MYAHVPQTIEMTNYSQQNQPLHNNYYSVGAYNPQPKTTVQTPLLKPSPDQIYRDSMSSPGINGPLQMRQCTDIFWCILFVLCFFAFFAFIGFGYYLGKPAGLLGFYNQDGVMCSTSATFPYAYFFDTSTVYCVRACPTTSPFDYLSTAAGGFSTSNTLPYASELLGDTVCVPQTTTGFSQTIPGIYLYQVFLDLKLSLYLMIASLGAAVILGLILICLFRCCPRFIIWVCCILVILSLIAIATYAFLYSKGIVYFTIPVDLSVYSTFGLQISAYVLWGLAGIFLMFLLCCYKRIRLSIGIIETTSLYISQTCQITFVPPTMALLWLGQLIALLSGLLYLYSVGTIAPSSGGYPFASVTKAADGYDYISLIFFYISIGLGIWILFFMTGLSSFMLSSAASIWYFGNSSIQMKPHRPICTSIWRAFRFHIGSIAFGSLILGICFPIRLIGSIFQRNYAEPSNCIIGCLYKMCDCCVACCSCFLQFMSKGCYTQIAINGTNYCTSTMQAFRLIATSPIRVAINSSLTQVLMFICKLTLCGLIGAGVFYSILSFKYFALISSPMIPTLLSMIIVYGASTIILSIFGTSSNVIIQCFIMDELDAKSRGQRARYCPAPLREIIDNNTYAD